ncbi:MAG TPA: hypothetical protein DEF47_08990 [Herpetosiphon sp.]|uniref:Cas10/Cmr2 second palm domain-containing protein n=1 Tax=Herpetosiphon aurantiacus (strain ATCC 23779 / DSM 785 / 114-95) TaxID=316274 RepID=A9AUN1_HERA2|nr:hypothetical protein [Herpetosiphon sp.]ABX04558.1 conserved hypothetical protein [Herpetosiphon aurantiacus DSM 785]HBW50030.1 hypothetical protein [Herpetosiphon sp.]
MTPVLVLIETSGIQQYIFGSNRLREQIGASHLVDQVTDTWLQEYGFSEAEPLLPPKELPAAQILWSGGGNTRLLFANSELAVQFTRTWSEKLLREAPDLRCLVVHQAWNENLNETHRQALAQMRLKKQTTPTQTPSLGLAVNAFCQSTGMPATGFNRATDKEAPELYPVSHAVAAKLVSLKDANDRLDETLLSAEQAKKYVFPYDFDNLGRSEHEHSYIAVVHIDGNGMGKRFAAIQQKYRDDDQGYLEKVRKLSELVRCASKKALQECVRLVIKQIIDTKELKASILSDKKPPKKAFRFPSLENESEQFFYLNDTRQGDQTFLPFRPIIYGGDDVTFVCDGRLGIALAIKFLQAFNQASAPENLHGCAGIAIVKAHYPFARAYDLAEQLCSSAKQKIGDHKASAIDWQIAMTGITGSLGEIREREYQTTSGASLSLRPVSITENAPSDMVDWNSVAEIIDNLRSSEWTDKKNKIMQLREVLRQGSDKVAEFEKLYKIDINRGWIDNVCMYFDPIELLDFYYPLEAR